MALAFVTREQFKIRSEVEVVHIPTGADFRAYPYSNPENVASAFEFVQRLVQVREVQSLAKLQMEFIQAQMQAMTEQAKDLSESATKAVMDAAKTPTKGGPSS